MTTWKIWRSPSGEVYPMPADFEPQFSKEKWRLLDVVEGSYLQVQNYVLNNYKA